DWAWKPTPEYVERAHVTRLMRAHGIETLEELHKRSVEDIAWFWDAVVKDLGIPFSTSYTQTLDDSDGAPWARWFVDGRVNIATACVDRFADDPATRDRLALIAESETGAVRRLTFGQLRAEVDAATAALQACDVGPGDSVAVYLPMVAEAVIAAYAIAKCGAMFVPIFSGFGAPAVAARLQDAEVQVLITADGTWRRGKQVAIKPEADKAVEVSPSVKTVVTLQNIGSEVAMQSGRDVYWADFVAPHVGVEVEAFDTSAEDIFMLAYTSGTTGKPKGAVHVHGGFLVKIASEAAYQLDVHPGDVFYWFTDMGWIMGPLAMVGAHANGAAMVMYEGAPDFPDAGRLWASVDKHNVTTLGVSPTLIRSLMPRGDQWPNAYGLSSLRIIGATGEPWNPAPYEWLDRVACRGKVPIMNISGGTEIGACLLGPHPVEPIRACSLGGPALGMDMDVFDAAGNSVRGDVGELVCKQPWPAMTRGIWGDRDRYLETYWSMYPGVWRHGDWARVDEDGQWFLLGRSDDTINVAGKRVGPAEVESVLVGHENVIEAAVVGIPDEIKGEVIWCFAVANSGAPELADELAQRVCDELGRPFKPARVVLVDGLPKTRSGKIVRRAVRAAVLGEDPGDLSTIENPDALKEITVATLA
ncbi:MAG: AMP-binding protein, partial [Thermoleophilaceae bacterium]|nr:AMP-binding protein [Thermoleophilaceae bacterium]